MRAPRRRVKVPAPVLVRAQKAAQPPAAPRPPPPPKPAARPRPLPREKVLAALARLTSHPMD